MKEDFDLHEMNGLTLHNSIWRVAIKHDGDKLRKDLLWAEMAKVKKQEYRLALRLAKHYKKENNKCK